MLPTCLLTDQLGQVTVLTDLEPGELATLEIPPGDRHHLDVVGDPGQVIHRLHILLPVFALRDQLTDEALWDKRL